MSANQTDRSLDIPVKIVFAKSGGSWLILRV